MVSRVVSPGGTAQAAGAAASPLPPLHCHSRALAQVYDIDDDGVVDEEDFRRMYIGGLGVKDDVHIEEVGCSLVCPTHSSCVYPGILVA